MSVRIINLRYYTFEKDEYMVKLDRSNKVLGNKFIMQNESERNKVCDDYELWFYEQIARQNPEVRDELRKLFLIAKNNENIAFGCWCYPKRCHTETIKKYLEIYLEANDISLGFRD